ncbi:MAG: hypothetical protein IPK26_26475 [Planctomycetes bacterium]|nr:hypothetical protein [Planctomycetota bacterium]
MPPTPPSRSRGLARVLVFIVVLLLAAGTAVWWRSQAARQQVVDQILADVATATADAPADASALSQLMTRIQQIEGHETDRGLCLALAQIEWARGRLDRALMAIRSWADGVDPTADELLLAARIQLARHASGSIGADAPDAVLRQALAFAEAAHGRRADASVLLLAWLAAFRLGDPAALQRLGDALAALGGKEAKLVAAAKAFTLEGPLEPLDELRVEFAEPPLELDLMRAQVLLQRGAIDDAITVLERLVAGGPAIVLVRHVGAVAWHARAMAATGAARTEALRQRDAHLAWLQKHAAGDDARRPLWQQLLEQG